MQGKIISNLNLELLTLSHLKQIPFFKTEYWIHPLPADGMREVEGCGDTDLVSDTTKDNDDKGSCFVYDASPLGVHELEGITGAEQNGTVSVVVNIVKGEAV